MQSCRRPFSRSLRVLRWSWNTLLPHGNFQRMTMNLAACEEAKQKCWLLASCHATYGSHAAAVSHSLYWHPAWPFLRRECERPLPFQGRPGSPPRALHHLARRVPWLLPPSSRLLNGPSPIQSNPIQMTILANSCFLNRCFDIKPLTSIPFGGGYWYKLWMYFSNIQEYNIS